MTESETFRMDRKTLEMMVVKLAERLKNMDKQMCQIEEEHKLINDLRVDLGKIQMQIKVTWGLLMMVVGGLVSVAFSLWK